MLRLKGSYYVIGDLFYISQGGKSNTNHATNVSEGVATDFELYCFNCEGTPPHLDRYRYVSLEISDLWWKDAGWLLQ